jgi:uncharacterized protein YdiU (UPF0061 family)
LLAEDKDAALNEAHAAIDTFTARFEAAYVAGLRRKLGLGRSLPDDLSLGQDLLERMADNGADFTLTFRGLCEVAGGPAGDAVVRKLFAEPSAFDAWAVRWRRRLDEEGAQAGGRIALMRSANPAFIPRNHLVEEAIAAAQKHQDYSRFETLLAVLSRPYEDQPDFASYADPPRPEQIVRQTFCGT